MWLYGALLLGVVYWAVAVNLTAHDPMVEGQSDAAIEVTGRIVAPVQQTPDRLVMIVRTDDPIDESGRVQACSSDLAHRGAGILSRRSGQLSGKDASSKRVIESRGIRLYSVS